MYSVKIVQDNIGKNNSKKANQLVKTLTIYKKRETNTIQDKDGKCLSETNDIIKR